jgi:sulfhydrogenase subunit gamma (sulfur reductase)
MADQPQVMRIVEVKDETPEAKLITVHPEGEWNFTTGQVAVVGVEGVGESYFAVASAPEDKGVLQFLVKNGKGAAGALFAMKAGDAVQVKGPVGKGFPIDDYKGRDIIIEAVGTAIAPMRGVIRSIMKRREDFGKVTAVFGVRVPEDFPFKNERDEWKQARIETLLTVSRPEGTGWTGSAGYVQWHCEEALEPLDKPVALICGMKDMMSESREELCRLGVDECDVLTNY